MKAAGASVFILPNGNLSTEHQADLDSWHILGKPIFRYKFINFLGFAHH